MELNHEESVSKFKDNTFDKLPKKPAKTLK